MQYAPLTIFLVGGIVKLRHRDSGVAVFGLDFEVLLRLFDPLGEGLALLLQVVHFFRGQDFELMAVAQSCLDKKVDLYGIIDIKEDRALRSCGIQLLHP